MKNIITQTAMLAVTCFALANTVLALSIGAGPSTIDYGKLVKGGYAEQGITVSTSGDENLSCSIELTGDLKDWLTVDKGPSFILPANGRLDLKAVIQPPADAANGRYTGAIYIKAAPTTSVTSGAGLAVGAGIKIKVSAEVSDEVVRAYKLKRSSVSSTEVGLPIKFSVGVENTGNVRIKPNVLVEIYDGGGNLKKTFVPPQSDLMPTVDTNVDFEIPSKELEVGRYTVKIIMDKEEQTMHFNMLERGTFALRGVLREVALNRIWGEVGESFKIMGKIENTGEVPIEDAKLHVEVYIVDETYQTEKLVKEFSSDESLNVPVGHSEQLNAYFTPSTQGRYVIYGALTYAGKRTEAKSTILNVLERQKDYSWLLSILIVLVLIGLFWITRKGEDGRTRRFKKIWGDYLQLK